MNLDRSEFIAWMQRLTERLNIIDEYIKKENSHHRIIEGEELLDNQDVLLMLKISTRSLQRYRSSGKLPYYTISGKVYYKRSDVYSMIKDTLSDPVINSRKPSEAK